LAHEISGPTRENHKTCKKIIKALLTNYSRKENQFYSKEGARESTQARIKHRKIMWEREKNY